MKNNSHLLIVDSNPHVGTILRQTLCNDFIVTVATSRQDILNILSRETRFECVITELGIPQFADFELLKIFQNHRLTKNTPVLVLTTNPNSSTRIKCLEEGADSVLAKPFNPMEVKAKLTAIMRRVNFTSSQELQRSIPLRAMKTQTSFRQLTSRILSFIV